MHKPESTIIVIATGFLALYFIFGWSWAPKVALIVGIIGIFSNYLSIKIDQLWMLLTKVLSFIVPNIILFIIFFIILTPIAMAYRILNKDTLMLKNTYKSHFLNVDRAINKVFFERTW